MAVKLMLKFASWWSMGTKAKLVWTSAVPNLLMMSMLSNLAITYRTVANPIASTLKLMLDTCPGLATIMGL